MSKSYNSVIDYLKWRGDLSFEQDAFNELDGFILSQLCYFDFSEFIDGDDTLLSEVITSYYQKHSKKSLKLGLFLPKTLNELCDIVKECTRYKDVIISDYEEKKDNEQFCGVLFHISKELIVISYRGTDDSLKGWLEDIEMIKSYPINSQSSALDYFKRINLKYKHRKFILLGHSKGGNLSIYASLYSSIKEQKNIVYVLNYDGPGFEMNHVDLDSYEIMKDRIINYYPVSSIIGRFFTPLGKEVYINSNSVGLFQHDGFYWHVKNNKFDYAPQLNVESEKFVENLNQFIYSLKEEQRENLYYSFEKYVDAIPEKSLLDLNKNKLQIIKSTRVFSRNDYKLFNKLVILIISSITKAKKKTKNNKL